MDDRELLELREGDDVDRLDCGVVVAGESLPDDLDDVEVTLVYLIETPPSIAIDAAIVRSDGSQPDWLPRGNPGGWHPAEWIELLAGSLGPWTMVVADRRVLSICHTPRPLTARTAEAGTWTAPDVRGRGYAAAATAEWAALLRPSGRHLFYATSIDNHSSQRVAARLHARCLGWVWERRDAAAARGGGLHPLSGARDDDVESHS